MQIQNPALEEMLTTPEHQKTNTTSSTDLEKSIPTWRDYYNN